MAVTISVKGSRQQPDPLRGSEGLEIRELGCCGVCGIFGETDAGFGGIFLLISATLLSGLTRVEAGGTGLVVASIFRTTSSALLTRLLPEGA